MSNHPFIKTNYPHHEGTWYVGGFYVHQLSWQMLTTFSADFVSTIILLMAYIDILFLLRAWAGVGMMSLTRLCFWLEIFVVPWLSTTIFCGISSEYSALTKQYNWRFLSHQIRKPSAPFITSFSLRYAKDWQTANVNRENLYSGKPVIFPFERENVNLSPDFFNFLCLLNLYRSSPYGRLSRVAR